MEESDGGDRAGKTDDESLSRCLSLWRHVELLVS